MPKILFIEHNGTEHLVDAAIGATIMQTAVDNSVPGIVGDCGGCCSCATCHGYIDPAWAGRIPSRSETEEMTLEGALDVQPNSRLTCQIAVNAEMDGIVVRLPASQF